MKKWFLLILCFISVRWGYAENVSVNQAMRVAENFSQQISGNQLRSAQTLQLVYTERPNLRSGGVEAYYYVFNNGSNDGYIIVSGDDRVYPILGYSASGNFSYETIPDNMKGWLQGYADQIRYACTNDIGQDIEIKEQWHNLIQGTKLPILRSQTLLNTAKWNQDMPFNSKCPLIQGKNALTGCVATSMGIVMKYHKHPSQGVGSASTTQGSYKADFGITYLWDKMLDDYSTDYTNDNVDAMATLLYHCGVSCDMKYGVSASSAQTARIIDALTQYFRYDKTISCIEKDDYDASEWQKILTDELVTNRRPVIYHGSGTDGHAFVIDGFDGSMYHINWGWGGYSDNWFSLTALKPDNQDYTYNQGMIINIKPDEGGQSLNELRISNANGYTGGLKVNITPAQGGLFTLTISGIRCFSPSFTASLSVGHYDKNENLKEVVATPQNFSFTPYKYYYNVSFSCKITEPIEEGDRLFLISQVGNEDYKIVEGGPNVADVINLTAGAHVNTYQITWNELPGVTVAPEKGYNADSVTEGGDFKFKIKNTNTNVIVVKNGETELGPDANGIYTLSNIRKDIYLTFSLEEPPISIYTITLPSVVGFDIKPASGYDPLSIPEGEDFEFTVIPQTGYEEYSIMVRVNGSVIYPNSNGYYIIHDIHANQTVEVVGTAPDPAVVYHIVTLPKVEGATTDPEPGDYKVENKKDFTFSLILDKEYDQSVPVVTIDRGDIITPNGNGLYLIENICEPIVIKIDGIKENTDVASEKIEASKIKVTASDGTVCIFTPQPMKVYIATFNGSIYKNLGVVSGDTRVQLPNGRYVVIVGENSFKVIL